MDVRDSITAAVRSVLADLGVDPLPTTVQLERPGNPDHGDWSTNVALASAKGDHHCHHLVDHTLLDQHDLPLELLVGNGKVHLEILAAVLIHQTEKHTELEFNWDSGGIVFICFSSRSRHSYKFHGKF